jgi:hypothetical protein
LTTLGRQVAEDKAATAQDLKEYCVERAIPNYSTSLIPKNSKHSSWTPELAAPAPALDVQPAEFDALVDDLEKYRDTSAASAVRSMPCARPSPAACV